MEVISIFGANLTSPKPNGIPISVANDSRRKTGRSTSFQPERTVSMATVNPANPIKETEVEKLIGNKANNGILTTESPNPKTARIKEPRKTTPTTSKIIVASTEINSFLSPNEQG